MVFGTGVSGNSSSRKLGMILSFSLPSPKIGNGIFHSRSCSQNLVVQFSISVPVQRSARIAYYSSWIGKEQELACKTCQMLCICFCKKFSQRQFTDLIRAERAMEKKENRNFSLAAFPSHTCREKLDQFQKYASSVIM